MIKATRKFNDLHTILLVLLLIFLSFNNLTASKSTANSMAQGDIKLAGTTWKGVAKGTLTMEVRMTLKFVNGTDATMTYDVLTTASGQAKEVQKDVKGTLKYTFDGKSNGTMNIKHIDLFGGASSNRPLTFTYNSNGTITLNIWLYEDLGINSIELKNQNTNSNASGSSENPKQTVENKAPEQKTSDESNMDNVFQIVEEMPSFPGGETKMLNYISKNLKYPTIARESGIQGRVFVSMVIEPDGSVTNVKVKRGIGGGCDEEAVRVIQSMPKWNPGKQNGKEVRVSYLIPVVFKL